MAKCAAPHHTGRCGLVDLPHLTAATFIPDPSNQLVVVGTIKHKLWMYDLRAGKRPQVEMEWGDARVTALVADPDGQRVWAANGLGRIEGVDMRARAMRGCLKGPAGSIRALALHPRPSPSCPSASSSLLDGPPLMASAGLDRFLRVHSTSAGQQALGKVYLKQQLTGVAWLRPPAEAAGVADEEEMAEGREQDGQTDHQQAIGDEQQQEGGALVKAKEHKKKSRKHAQKGEKEGKGKSKKQRH
ncbi:hypothetical protein DUNSADRAFT_7996 [Dunaliella salina]|uniref:Ribosome biogenesis protein NSA1 n=1 Tax=Dunaliella salina TaxID=3046 RepID=A0ABQ7GKB0_DUNSA|nr:hypothetical protein DUNSADRAFT_7996 [Dunaliella salina]|eukprot:KAF5835052.1 hypothetical protein DUNSADRAFT_7996 [Dunaliella salina]